MPDSGLRARVDSHGRLLVIDDDPLVAQAFDAFLCDEHHVLLADDAETALARIQAGERFDAILCDVMMPGMSGIDFHRALVAAGDAHAARIVFITGGVYSAEARSYLATVENVCVDKPPDPDELSRVLRRVVDASLAHTAPRARSA